MADIISDVVNLAPKVAEIFGAKNGQTAVDTIVCFLCLHAQTIILIDEYMTSGNLVKNFDFSKVCRLFAFSSLFYMLTLLDRLTLRTTPEMTFYTLASLRLLAPSPGSRSRGMDEQLKVFCFFYNLFLPT